MTNPAQRMSAMCARHRAQATSARVAEQVACLSQDHEAEAMDWIEAVADFDTEAGPASGGWGDSSPQTPRAYFGLPS